MEEYFQYMRTLHTQIDDVESRAAKASLEEQTLITIARTLEIDRDSVRSQTIKVKEDNQTMEEASKLICAQISDKQRRIASLESEIFTLSQSLQLIKKERSEVVSRITEKRDYFAKKAEEAHSNFLSRKNYAHSYKSNEAPTNEQEKNKASPLKLKLETAKNKLSELKKSNLALAANNSEVEQSIEELKSKATDLKSEYLMMDMSMLEEECKALLSDIQGETDFLKSLEDQILQLRGLSHTIKCECDYEYKVAID